MRVLITGGCGLIGRTLTSELENRPGYEIRLLDRTLPENATIFAPGVNEEGRAPAPLELHHPFIQAEITDVEAMKAACEGMDAVVHLAGRLTGEPENGVETFKANALGTFVVIDTAQKAGVKRFFCASSINAFGTIYWRLSGKPSPYTTMPLDEEFAPVPEDPYSLSKYVNEETCAAYSRAYGMTAAAFRFAGVWSDELYQSKLAEGLQPTTAWSDELYQWVHVADLVRGIRQALEAPDLPSATYTLGAADTRCPEPTLEILQKFRPDLAVNLKKPLQGREPLMSIDRARAAFGYDPQYRLGP